MKNRDCAALTELQACFPCCKHGLFKETDLFDQITFESISVGPVVKQVDLVFVECVLSGCCRGNRPPTEAFSVYLSS